MGKLCTQCYHVNHDSASSCSVCGWPLSEYYDTAAHGRSRDSIASDEGMPPEDGYYYTYTWFGTKVSVKKWAWNLGIAVSASTFAVCGLIFLAFGLWVNAIMFVLIAALGAWLGHLQGKKKWSYGKGIAVGFLLTPLVIAAICPWQVWYDASREAYLAPRFVDHFTVTFEGETHIVVDGYVVNEGRTGSAASIEFTAWGGAWNSTDDPFGGFVQEHVTTSWMAAEGGRADVHWECTLSYFHGDGRITWTMDPV